jgi:methionyl-tRNA synthetase
MTIALPYANGDLHLGHLVEGIQADIWHRLHQFEGHETYFISASDAHGTPIMLSARQQNITPEELVNKMHADHEKVYQDFFVNFDNFYSTHSPENKKLSELIYQRLSTKGDIKSKNITQAYDPKENIFLSDRYIKGECPKCHTAGQYGDNCEACGATYSPMELINPISSISGVTPIEKDSEHFFFHLENYSDMLREWIESPALQIQIRNKLKEWFVEGLEPWDISRDAPYFGFEIPGHPGKYFYVWLDAPIGYMASTENLFVKLGKNTDEIWNPSSTYEVHHFVGKDIVYFHALFWPAMLEGADFRRPTSIKVHGFLTINGQKMSKSRGTFITANQYLSVLDPEYLRYYFAAKLSAEIEDLDLNLTDFALRINSDLVGKYVNLASRCAGFISKQFDGVLADALPEPELFNTFTDAGKTIFDDFETLHYAKAVRDIMALCDRANQYIDHEKPWALAKEPGNEAKIQAVCTQGLNLFKVLSAYLKPILPKTLKNIEDFLNILPLDSENFSKPLLNHKINVFKPLIQRITPEHLEKLQN